MAKVWKYEEMITGAAQASPEYNPGSDFFENPTYGTVPVPTAQQLYDAKAGVGVSDEDFDRIWVPYWEENPSVNQQTGGYRDYVSYAPTEEEVYRFLLAEPYYARGVTPSPEELERTRQQRIAQRGATRAKTRIASVAEMRNRRGASGYLAAQTQLSGTGDTLGAGSPQLGARAELTGLR